MPSNQSQTHSNLSAIHNVRKQPVECHRTGSPLPFPNAVQRALICLQGDAEVDQLKVPPELNAGKYLFQWRWDAENSPQVWGNCADVVIE